MRKYVYILAGIFVVIVLVSMSGESETWRERTVAAKDAISTSVRSIIPGGDDEETRTADSVGITATDSKKPLRVEPDLRRQPELHTLSERPRDSVNAPQADPAVWPENTVASTEPDRSATGAAKSVPRNTRTAPSGRDGTPAAPEAVAGTGAPAKISHPLGFAILSPGQVPLQSPARPLGLDIIAEVEASPDDPGYTEFVGETLPDLTPRLEKHFKQRKKIVENSIEAEFDDLYLEEDAYVRIYFIKEGTVFHNSLGISLEDEDKLIFPNASSVSSYFRDSTTRKDDTSEEAPLIPGDYVDLGLMKKGSLLDLFLIKDGARDPDGPVYGFNKEDNPDRHNHMRIHDVLDDDTLIIGFEDLPRGGDRDYNDLVIAVQRIPVNQR